MIIEVGEVDALIPIVFEHILQQLLALIGDPNPVGFVVNFFYSVSTEIYQPS